MTPDRDSLLAAIAALETQRGVLGDAVTELALAPLRALLAQAEGVAPAEPAPQLRRAQVTVLFADIVESTALASRLDAEDVLQIFGGVLQRAAACVRARGGRVLRYTGDGLKAGFGTQGTREDDAAQAVLAGLDILAAAREHAEWVAREHGVQGFALRVGAHTGEVALGAGFEADNTLTGDTVNIAARMEQAAPPGGLRISAETWAHVRGQFDVEAQPPLSVKGIAAPLQTVLVQRVHPDAQRRSARGIEGLPTRMVGRDTELGTLQAAFQRLHGQRRLAVLTVVADAGVGKSRLLDEFDAWRRARPEPTVVLRGHTNPQTENQIFGLLRDILARHCLIADDDSLDVARAKLERGVVPLFVEDDGPDLAEGHAHLLGHLIGIEWRDSRHIQGILDDPRQLRSRGMHAALQFFPRLAARAGCPMVLQIEDLHWADVESLALLDQLVQAQPDTPLLLLALSRPTLFERVPSWGEGAGTDADRMARPARRLPLAPLDTDGSDALVTELLRKLPTIPPALREMLTQQAEGNPFYIEELVKVLIDRGAITLADPWQVDIDRLAVTRLPTTLTGVLQARLDGLPLSEKRTLQQASVVGALFWADALAAIDTQAPVHLPSLVRRALARPQGEPAATGLHAYAFHHQLLQVVAYSTVLKQDRRVGHAQVARWMSTLNALRAGDFLGLAAWHFEQAGAHEQAIEFHARAAEHAVQRFAHERVLAHVGRALALLAEGTPAQASLRWRLLTVREQTLTMQGRRDEQAVDLDALARLAEADDNDRWRAEVARRLSLRAMRTADWAAQERHARDSLASATRAGDDPLRLQALRLLASARTMQRDLDGGVALAEQGLADARRLGLRGAESGLLNVVNMGAALQGDLLRTLDLTQQSLVVLRETGNRANEAIALSNLGGGWMKLGQLDHARPPLEAALRMLRAHGDRTMEGAVLGILSALVLWQGDAEQALVLAHAAVDSTQATQARDMEVYAWLKVGHAQLALGRPDSARQACAEAHRRALAIGHPTQHDASAGLASVALALGDADAALTAVQPVLAHVAGGGTLDDTEYPRQVEWVCHQALLCAADPRAVDWLARAHGALMAQAQALPVPALQQALLHNIPHHRAIVAAWAAATPPGPA